MFNALQRNMPYCFECQGAHNHHYKQTIGNKIACFCSFCGNQIFVADSPFSSRKVTRNAVTEMNRSLFYDERLRSSLVRSK